MVRLDPSSWNQDYNWGKSEAHTIPTWCVWCYGTGLRRHRSHSIDPRVTIKTCNRCKGRKKIWVREGSNLHKAGESFTPGLYPGLRKSKL